MQLVHYVNRDALGLANDFLSLGFIPEGVDLLSVSVALRASFGDGTGQSQDFQVHILLSSMTTWDIKGSFDNNMENARKTM